MRMGSACRSVKMKEKTLVDDLTSGVESCELEQYQTQSVPVWRMISIRVQSRSRVLGTGG